MDMRGLKKFIEDIREVADNREAEVQRVEVELAKIRSKFKGGSSLSAYDRKKYVCKLLFIFMLGYRVEFGHMESVQLLGGESSSEKLIGYLAMALFLHEGHELLTLTTHTVCVDLAKGDELRRCLALTALANVGGRDFADAMSAHLQTLTCNKATPTLIRKKAFLATLRIHRKFKGIVDPAIIGPVAADALNANDLSLSLAAATLCLGLLQDRENLRHLQKARHTAVKLLESLIIDRASTQDFVHCGVPSPWLQGKCIRLLQEFPPPSQVEEQETISGVLSRIVRATTKTIQEAQTSSVSRNDPLLIRTNCMVSVLSEIVSLVIQWNVNTRLLTECRDALGLLLNDRKDPNRRYVGLTLLTRLSFCEAFVEAQTAAQTKDGATPAVVDGQPQSFATSIAKYQPIIVAAMHDADESLRKRALDLLYAMCDANNAAQIVGELLEYLKVSDPRTREDLVLMVAILAEKFCGDVAWYVDVLVALLEQAGPSIADDVWHRLVHVAVNVQSVQTHAVDAVYRTLVRNPSASPALVQVGALLLGEFGYQIALNAGSSPAEQVHLVAAKIAVAGDATKAMLLSTLVKFYNLYDNPAVREKVRKLIQGYKSSFAAELQQRAAEYYYLITEGTDELLQAALEPLPAFEVRAGSMADKLRSKRKGEAKDLWSEKGGARDAAHLKQSAVLREAAAGAAGEASATQGTMSSASSPSAMTSQRHVDPAAAAVTQSKAATSSSQARGLAAPASDLDSIFSGVSPPAPMVEVGPVQDENDTRAFRGRFVPAGESALVYEDKFLRVRCKYERRGADARGTVSIENAFTGGNLEDLDVRIATTPGNLMLQQQPFQSKPVPPQGSVDSLFACRSLGVFEGQPKISVAGAFGAGVGRTVLSIGLPFCSTTFLEPYKLEDKSKFEALWGNTRGGRSGGSPCTSKAVELDATVLAATHGDSVAAVERMLFRHLGFFTVRATPTKVYAIAAHAMMPAEAVQYTPVMVIADCGGAGSSGAGGGTAAAADDPFGFDVPKPASATTTPKVVDVETKTPEGALQGQVHGSVLALLRNTASLPPV